MTLMYFCTFCTKNIDSCSWCFDSSKKPTKRFPVLFPWLHFRFYLLQLFVQFFSVSFMLSFFRFPSHWSLYSFYTEKTRTICVPKTGIFIFFTRKKRNVRRRRSSLEREEKAKEVEEHLLSLFFLLLTPTQETSYGKKRIRQGKQNMRNRKKEDRK